LSAELEPFYLAAVFIFGLLLGSFLKVCIYRIPRDLSVASPRSFCPECGLQIAWYDNVPLLSYLLLRGRCRSCGRAVGLRYPVVEFTTAVLLAITAFRYGYTFAALKWSLFECILIVLFWTDLEERLLPDELTIGGSVAGLIFAIFLPVKGQLTDLLLPASPVLLKSLINAGAGAFLAVPLWLLGWIVGAIRKREALGMGDVKLVVLIGIFLGFEASVPALMIGAVAGSIVGLGYLVITRKEMAGFELPMGSFFCLGACLLPLLGRA
jgi:leader peptidase (prepilin peptidase) / N-methyltransferase